MKRRSFLQAVGSTAVVFCPGHPIFAADDELTLRTRSHREWTAMNDQAIARSLTAQQRQKGHADDGGFTDRHGVYQVGAAGHRCALFMTGYLNRESKYHESDEVAESMLRAIRYLTRKQHRDGTIDLVITNFHSTPDTGFVVEPLALAHRVLNQQSPQSLNEYREASSQFLQRAAKALQTGGIHTPNHRWVVSMALARIHVLFPDSANLQRIDQWLDEHIDIDPDGQYTERSIAVYSPLVNRCLITMARLLDRPQLLDPVRRNLELTRYFVRANGELVTESSRRQDQYRVANAAKYYYPYCYLALRDQNGQFSAMAKMIERTVGLGALASHQLIFTEDESLDQQLPAATGVPTNYAKHFPHSDVVRIRRESVDATILTNNSTLFTYANGNAVLRAVRVASAFFGRGQFVSETIECPEASTYVLRQTLKAAYYQPFPRARISADGRWSAMPRDDREESEEQTIHTVVTVKEYGGRFTIRFQIDGTDHVPVAIELAFRHGGKLSGVRPIADVEEAYLLDASEMGVFEMGDDRIRFGPGRAEHAWTQLRGAESKLDAQSVYLTGQTPFDLTLSIESTS